jgi:hypothetical protein
MVPGDDGVPGVQEVQSLPKEAQMIVRFKKKYMDLLGYPPDHPFREELWKVEKKIQIGGTGIFWYILVNKRIKCAGRAENLVRVRRKGR